LPGRWLRGTGLVVERPTIYHGDRERGIFIIFK
jgi:hypothetical protein